MKGNRKIFFILIAIPVLFLVLIASCSSQTVTKSATISSTSTVTATEKVTATATVTATPSTITVTSYPTTPVTTTPAVYGSEIPGDAKFFASKTITGQVTTTPAGGGTPTTTSVYSDAYLPLQETGRYTKETATFVPRINTVTFHDDWFFRFSIPFLNVKPWLVNWKYTTASSDPATSLTFYLFRKKDFEAYYYNNPLQMVNSDLKSPDWGVSETGFRVRQITDMSGDFVIVLRASDATKIQGWIVRIGM